MLVCSAGMSTSLLVTKCKSSWKQKEWTQIFLQFLLQEADQHLESKPVDVLLLGPQVRFMEITQFEQKLAPKGIPLEVINMADYGMMNGEKSFSTSRKLMEVVK